MPREARGEILNYAETFLLDFVFAGMRLVYFKSHRTVSVAVENRQRQEARGGI